MRACVRGELIILTSSEQRPAMTQETGRGGAAPLGKPAMSPFIFDLLGVWIVGI